MPQMFPIQISGTILKNLEAETDKSNQQENFIAQITNDGSFSLLSKNYKEAFHSRSGAKEEAEFKYLAPAEIIRFKSNENINILDICFGLGYNSACLIEQLNKRNISVKLWGLEIDNRPLQLALQSEIFTNSWSCKVLEILKEIERYGKWEKSLSSGNIIWGDARVNIHNIPKETKFNLILLDPFSPQNCPQLWSEEFLCTITSKLKDQGRLITYCTAAAIRGSFKRAGLTLRSLSAKKSDEGIWSAGTIGILNPKKYDHLESKSPFRKLSKMEEEHIMTRAGIPYRDPSGCSTAQEIIERRKKEQKYSPFENSTSWKKRWNKADFTRRG